MLEETPESARSQSERPYLHTSNLHDRSGVYAVIDKRRDGINYVIDVGESANVKTRFETHDRADCWARNQYGTLTVAVLYTPHLQQAERRAIEQEIRSLLPPACGIG